MSNKIQRFTTIVGILAFSIFALGVLISSPGFERATSAQVAEPKVPIKTTPTPAFDQKAAIEKIKEQIKGKENLPAGEVFENLKDYAKLPAGRLLTVMEFGYSRSLGVDCTHCHTPEDWASDKKVAKATAREMRAMIDKINGEMLPAIKAFEGRTGRQRAIVNCTTCHRGEVKPATRLGN